MNVTYKNLALATTLVVAIFSSCNTLKETDGPYFGNGFHNGWADQNSIVLWTRLTQNPDGNAEGTNFIELSSKQANKLDK